MKLIEFFKDREIFVDYDYDEDAEEYQRTCSIIFDDDNFEILEDNFKEQLMNNAEDELEKICDIDYDEEDIFGALNRYFTVINSKDLRYDENEKYKDIPLLYMSCLLYSFIGSIEFIKGISIDDCYVEFLDSDISFSYSS